MSAKGRGPLTGGKENYYTTPSWAVRRLLERWAPPCPGFWLEPSAGNGALIRSVNAVRQDVSWLALELRAEERDHLALVDYCRPVIGNFLQEDPFAYAREDVTVVLGNPPYSHALPFVLRAHELFPNAEITYLLRIAFVASQDRHPFISTHMPDLFVLPDRPSFIGDGGGDSADYAWCRWPVDWERTTGSVQLLDLTPLSERQRDKGHDVMLEPAQRSLFE